MASAIVWADVRARLGSAAGAIGVPIAWPNETFELPADGGPFLVVRTEGGLRAPMEIGRGGLRQEDGSVWLFVMVPTGTGVEAGFALRDLLCDLFLDTPPTTEGVEYPEADLDAGGSGEDGGYRSLPLRIGYRAQLARSAPSP